MQICVCLAKLHNVTVTEANPDYKGSITIGRELMIAAGIRPHQMLIINNCENGDTWRTYAISGDKGQICLNGRPPAHHFTKGDKVIILAEGLVDDLDDAYSEIVTKVVLVDDTNAITQVAKYRLGDLEQTMCNEHRVASPT